MEKRSLPRDEKASPAIEAETEAVAATNSDAEIKAEAADDGGVPLTHAIVLHPAALSPVNVPSRKFLKLAHDTVALHTLNAVFSTYGGGYFLTKHLDFARSMALKQQAIAAQLQSPVLASEARLHLVYIYVQEGEFARARQMLAREAEVAVELDSSKLQGMVHAAQSYIDKLEAHRDKLERQHPDFARQWIVPRGGHRPKQQRTDSGAREPPADEGSLRALEPGRALDKLMLLPASSLPSSTDTV